MIKIIKSAKNKILLKDTHKKVFDQLMCPECNSMNLNKHTRYEGKYRFFRYHERFKIHSKCRDCTCDFDYVSKWLRIDR